MRLVHSSSDQVYRLQQGRPAQGKFTEKFTSYQIYFELRLTPGGEEEKGLSLQPPSGNYK